MRWRIDIGLVVAFAVLTATLAIDWPPGRALLDLDVAAADWSDAHRPYAAYLGARVLLLLGQGWFLEVAAALATGWVVYRRRSVRPIVVLVASYLALNLVIGPIKVLTDRAAPHFPVGVANREEFFSGGLEFPSGHVANAFVWFWLLALLLDTWLPSWAARTALIVTPIVVAMTTTYLGYHWLTDSIAGLPVGLLIVRALRRVDWNEIPLGRWLAGRGWAGPVRELG